MFTLQKLAASCMAGLLAISLAACAADSSAGGAESAAAKAAKDCTFTMIPKSTDNPYFAAVKTGMLDAQKELGGTLEYVGPAAGEVTGQIQRIQSASQQGSCVIGIAALDASAVAPALDQAKAKGAKIITWDADVVQASRGIFVNMASAKDLGESQFDLLAKALNNQGEWAIISSQSTAESKNLWIKAMEAKAAQPEYSGMKLVKTTYGDDDSKKSYDLAVGILRGYPNLKGIMAPTPIALEASVKAVDDLGLTGKVVVTGLGNPGNDAQLLKDGKVPAYVLWSPRQLGYASYYAAWNYYEGKIKGAEGDKFTAGKMGELTIGANGELIYGKPIVFTKDNVDGYMSEFQSS